MKNFIAAKRQALNLTQKQLCAVLEIKEQALQRYERGVVIPSVAMALKIANALNTTVEELFETDD